MTPETIMVLGSFGLGTIVAYSWWISTRVELFRLDLMELRSELDLLIENGQASIEDRNWRKLRESISWLIDFAPYLSVSVCLLYLKICGRSQEEARSSFGSVLVIEGLGLTGDCPDFYRLRTRVIVRSLMHLCLSPSFLLLLILSSLTGRTERLISLISGLRGEPLSHVHSLPRA